MKQLIEAVEKLLDESEKLEDGTYIVPKFAARKLIRALKSCREENKDILKEGRRLNNERRKK